MSRWIPVTRPEPGWVVLLYGPPLEIQLLADELDRSGMRIVRIDDHFFLQAPDIFDPLSLPEEVAWAAAAILQQLNTAARLRYGVRLPVHSGSALLIERDGRWNGMQSSAPSRKSEATVPVRFSFHWGRFGKWRDGDRIWRAPWICSLLARQHGTCGRRSTKRYGTSARKRKPGSLRSALRRRRNAPGSEQLYTAPHRDDWVSPDGLISPGQRNGRTRCLPLQQRRSSEASWSIWCLDSWRFLKHAPIRNDLSVTAATHQWIVFTDLSALGSTAHNRPIATRLR